jgi:glycosyltransferase involved in cell wall biosynthesis
LLAVKILHVIGDLAAFSGGPAKACFEMARAVARRGHQVALYTTDYGQPPGSVPTGGAPQLRDGVTLRWFPLQQPRFWLTSWPLRRALMADVGGFDLVHVHSLYLFHDWAAEAACRRARVPYIVRPHGTLDPFIQRRRRAKKVIVERWFQDRMLAHAAAIHYTAEDEMRLAAPFVHGAPGFVVPNGLELSDYARLPPRGSFRRRHPELGTAPIVLFLGRLNFKKGLDLLADAFGRLRDRAGDARLVIAGPDGGFRRETEGFVDRAGIRDRTLFTGLLQGEDKLAALADADLFVLPSYSENFGIAVVEAMACGLPVVISDQVNIWREIEGDGAGLVTPCEAGVVADAIARLLADPDLRRRMGEAAKVSVAQRYAWDKVAEQLEAAYARILAQRAGPRGA